MDTNALSTYFNSIDEPYAAGVFEDTDKGLFYRHCKAYSRWYDSVTPPSYETGERLYPSKDRHRKTNISNRGVVPAFGYTYDINFDVLEKKGCLPGSPAYEELKSFEELSLNLSFHHGAPNYRRIIKEGLSSYRDRVLKLSCDTEQLHEFRQGLILLLDSMKGYLGRCCEYLCSVGAPEELICALSKVPFSPADTYYEGLVSWNSIFYFDNCDNLGCLDKGLAHLYNGEDLTDVIAELFANADAMGAWSCSIGPEINEISRQALRAADGRRRPMLELKINGELPEDVWEQSFTLLKNGNSNPSFYNDAQIQSMLHEHFPLISKEDLTLFCGCGCTETNLEGLTRAGGTDPDVNLLKIFEDYLYEKLPEKESFEDFFEGLCKKTVSETQKALDRLDETYYKLSKNLPNPIRTILFDDCIDKGLDFNAGGARYSWSMNSESGLINVIDSLAGVKELYYKKKKYSAEEFLSLLSSEDADFYDELRCCPCFGVDDEETDAMGAEFARRVFNVYHTKKPVKSFIDGFMLTEHQFLRHIGCGEVVGPTPDGRKKGEPTCDSVAALRGKAVKGPTAMLNSSARLPQQLVDGISVVNVTLSKEALSSAQVLKGLVCGYFGMGGVQLQFTVTSEEELKDAMLHPEKHNDLIVRVGGYSDYFNNLSPELKKTIIERNIHSL